MRALRKELRRPVATMLFALLVRGFPFALHASENPPPQTAGETPERFRRWLDEEVTYIITDAEREAFSNLRSVEEREAFIEAFWRRRDPEPLTPINEFEKEHYRRLEFSNRELGRESAVPGWMTARGRMYVILGEPDDRETFRSVPFLYPAEVWFYQADREKGLPPLYLLFFQEGHAGPYRLFNHAIDGPEKLMPAQPFGMDNFRMEAYQFLQEISPDLAHASITMRADRSAYGDIVQPDRSSLDTQVLLGDIQMSAYRRVDTSYVDAARGARGLVESAYLFNYVPSSGMANVLPGPGGASFVHYGIELDPQHLTLAKGDGRYYTTFELHGEVVEDDGTVVLDFIKEPHLGLTESQFQNVKYRPFAFRDMFPLVSGRYRFRVVMKNPARNEYTIFDTPLLVPERSNREARLGDPVLLYAVAEDTGGEAASVYRTYQLGPVMLEPNALKVYPAGSTLLVYVPIENASADHRLSMRLVHQEDTATAVTSKSVAQGLHGTAPIIEQLSLEGTVGGRYRLVLDLTDPSGKIVATGSEDFDVSPRSSISRPWVLRESVQGENVGRTRAALAEQYLRKGRIEEARRSFELALDDEPALLMPRLFLARYRLDEQRPREAVKLLEPVETDYGDNAEVLLTLGDAHFQLENYSRAAGLFESALALRGPNTLLLNALARCHMRLGNEDAAIDYLSRSLDLDPDQESVRSMLRRLETY